MSGTYRTTLVYVRDGHYSHGVNARNGAAEMKKIDRRMKRRQSARITRDALREHEESQALDMSEMMSFIESYEDFDCDSLYDVNDDLEDDFNDDYWSGDYGYHPGDDWSGGWEDYSDLYGFDSRRHLVSPAEKAAESEGVSLGEILDRIRKEKGLA